MLCVLTMSINPLFCVLTRSIHIPSGECCDCHINDMRAMYADNVNIPVVWDDSVNNCYVLTVLIYIASGECFECHINAMRAIYADNVSIPIAVWADSVKNCYVF